jgi:hypothetical protein
MFRAILCSSSKGQNCIVTASGIVTLKLSECPYITLVIKVIIIIITTICHYSPLWVFAL